LKKRILLFWPLAIPGSPNNVQEMVFQVPPDVMRRENLRDFQRAWAKRLIRRPIEFLETGYSVGSY